MSASEAGYDATGGMRKSRAATTTPLCASASLIAVSCRRSPRHQAPPCKSMMSGKGSGPRGLKSRASSGVSPWRIYSTSSMSIAYVLGALAVMICSSQSRTMDSLNELIASGVKEDADIAAHGLEPQDVLVEVPGLVQIQRGEPDGGEPFV